MLASGPGRCWGRYQAAATCPSVRRTRTPGGTPIRGPRPSARVEDSPTAGVRTTPRPWGGTPLDGLLPVVLALGGGSAGHQQPLTACLLQTAASGAALPQSRVFRTGTSQWQELAQGLLQEGCRHVAREGTGV
jgi:hypothetical protein